MRLVAFDHGGSARLGVLTGETVVDLKEAAPNLPQDLIGMLRAGQGAFDAAAAASKKAASTAHRPVETLRHLMPIQNPGKVVCMGFNFAPEKPDYPQIFLRCNSSLVAHGEAIIRPPCSTHLDYEAELVAIIGQKARHIDEANALSIVAGYASFNDATIRDYQFKASQWTMGKNFDKTGAFGPSFVTADETPPGCIGLTVRSWLNGKMMQNANLGDMTYSVADAIVIVTECMTLEPGDLLVMGTPTGNGSSLRPQIWMKSGDTIEVEVEGLGRLRNTVLDEAEAS